jgi:hypothetical protein
MREEYDFKGGERGKFYRPGAKLQLPVYLDGRVESWFSEKAERKGVSLDDLLNEVLKRETALIESVE